MNKYKVLNGILSWIFQLKLDSFSVLEIIFASKKTLKKLILRDTLNESKKYFFNLNQLDTNNLYKKQIKS